MTVTTPASTDSQPPSVPGDVTAQLAPYTCDLALVTWAQSTDDADDPADLDYEIVVNAALARVVRGAGTGTAPLAGPGPYAVAVRAVDSSGNASALSSPVSVVVDPLCEP